MRGNGGISRGVGGMIMAVGQRKAVSGMKHPDAREDRKAHTRVREGAKDKRDRGRGREREGERHREKEGERKERDHHFFPSSRSWHSPWSLEMNSDSW